MSALALETSTYRLVAAHIADITSIPADKLTPGSRWNDIGMDSFDLVELWSACEIEFGIVIAESEAELLNTIGDFVALVDKKTTGPA